MNTERLGILRDRAAMLSRSRNFFQARGVFEVDCPAISANASVDAHIDLIPAADGRYLHSSPEYGMKRLLSEGFGDIYQLSHVYRNGEIGQWHNPEFMMAEWYRISFTFKKIIEETADFIRLFLGELPLRQISYRQAFQDYCEIDPFTTTTEKLLSYINKKNISSYPNIENEDIDALLNLILATEIEPILGENELTALTHYPSSQSALAQKITLDGVETAERFEIYYKGRELCNGYHELCDADEQQRRLIEANSLRKKLGKEPLPIDNLFLKALERGLPDCCGVAVGFDRLMMLRNNVNNISKVIPFDWEHA